MCDLSQYYNVKFLSLDLNMIEEIQGLEYLINLTSLHLQGNRITKVSGLDRNVNLRVLNLSDNHIAEIGEGLKHLTKLTNLNLAKNHLVDFRKVVDDLNTCPLTSLDISNNKLDDLETPLDDFCDKLAGLRCLYLHRNPGTRGVKGLRKKLISKLPDLNYLDDRPVSIYERRGDEINRRDLIKANEMRDDAWEERQKKITERRNMALERIARESLARGLNQTIRSMPTTRDETGGSDDRGVGVEDPRRQRTIHTPSTGQAVTEVPWNDEQLWQSVEVNREAIIADANLMNNSSHPTSGGMHDPPTSPTSRTTTVPNASDLGDMD
ncbi:hypothetical protein FOL47_001950 [Perkinsus chesapeaki]|uniref:Uncharacterized protein n=1 Tax=Perkinsus chesapeaki TaxID=330153 RepID=A0A7J6N168_PERCH|nr:hypothetical protein FOL47_001950 [Perkinsus chesapeaki]